jgi:hypothetical protein
MTMESLIVVGNRCFAGFVRATFLYEGSSGAHRWESF